MYFKIYHIQTLVQLCKKKNIQVFIYFQLFYIFDLSLNISRLPLSEKKYTEWPMYSICQSKFIKNFQKKRGYIVHSRVHRKCFSLQTKLFDTKKYVKLHAKLVFFYFVS